MSPATIAVLGTRYNDFAIEEAILCPLGARLVVGAGSDGASIVEVAKDADVVLAGSGPRFDAAVIAALSCRGIVRYGVGTDSIDLAAAERAGIWIARVSDYGTEAVAIHAVTMALAGLRRLGEADARVRAGGWGFAQLRPLHLPSAMTAGVIGYGRIGRRVAGQLGALGFRMLAHDPYATVDADDVPVESASLDETLARCDVVSLHLPSTPDGRPLLDESALARMKAGSVLVNTARGSLVDTRALVRAMHADRPRVAALDVHDPEPPDLADLTAPDADVAARLLLTPHMAWYTEESETDMRTKAAEEAARLLRGESPLDAVVAPRPGPEATLR